MHGSERGGKTRLHNASALCSCSWALAGCPYPFAFDLVVCASTFVASSFTQTKNHELESVSIFNLKRIQIRSSIAACAKASADVPALADRDVVSSFECNAHFYFLSMSNVLHSTSTSRSAGCGWPVRADVRYMVCRLGPILAVRSSIAACT